MRYAVLVTLWDPRSPDGERNHQECARVAGRLEELGFRVLRPEGAESLEDDFGRGLRATATDDEVLVHVSGRLTQSGDLLVPGANGLPLRRLADVLAAMSPMPRCVWIVADLVQQHGDDAGFGPGAADPIEPVLTWLGVRERGHGAIVSLRPPSCAGEPLALTHRLLEATEGASGEMTLASAYERAAGLPESRPETPGARFVPGLVHLHLVTAFLPRAWDGTHPATDTTADDPLDPAKHANDFVRHMAEGRADAAFLAALALEELGALNADHHALLRQFRSVSPVRARGTLDAAAWDLLRAPTPNEALAGLLRVVAPSGMAARLDQLVEWKRLVALDPAGRLDETSTASVVRSFQWSARVLDVVSPALYFVAEVPGDIAAVRGREPSTAVGPSVVSGRSAKDLAFLAGRHLTYYRPEHQVVVYYPTHDELLQLVLAAQYLVAPGAASHPSPAVVGLAARLARYLRPAERAALVVLAGSVSQQRPDGESVDLSAWARGVELTAARAGLFLSGDLAPVMALVRSESRSIAGLSFDEKRSDLIAFCTSTAHVALRDRFAVTDAVATPSSEPPHSDARPGVPPEWRARAVD